MPLKKFLWMFSLGLVVFVVTACGQISVEIIPSQTQHTPDSSAPTTLVEPSPDSSTPEVSSPNMLTTEISQPQSGSDIVQPTDPLVVKPADPNTTPGHDNIPPMGTIAGKLSYPSSFIPSMRVAFFSMTDGSISYTDLAFNQGTYQMDLPEGIYHVVAYPYDPSNPNAKTEIGLAGGYTAAVPCGLSVDCIDHSLLDVTVVAGQTVTADPGDWYAPQGSFPPMPIP